MSTRSYTSTSSMILVICCLFFTVVQANWDEATGFVHDHKVSPGWMAKNPPKSCSKNIQLAECSHNTRNAFPNVQFMAVFTVDHSKDTYHGCSYGSCCYFSAFPPVTELVSDPTNSHIFVWHNLGGFKGLGTNPIANPQTGTFGYEDGTTGKYIDGPPNRATYQAGHDSKYPGFKLPPAWPATMPMPAQKNAHPSCGKPGEPNKDPNPTGKPGGGQSAKPNEVESKSKQTSSKSTPTKKDSEKRHQINLE
ncbi:uncharacterized protein MELLADRAFT_107296 [Melampsora larici-populina 98AG31]|uniref:Secreted protein n=1 Tax=Melampsora larici-populina (strain 98AG31 / pathotype 3-4-7) TaxID=747676 RepID=F4RNV3_MELLP|nr:uncharacterized protein MELLADRAFT_107296 [Melampsora larici-populina 98AG31]EGG05810.1 secreted protein [Melampsora larici-populina 98AG31]